MMVKEVVSGQDCGLNIENYNDVQVGDIIESFEEKRHQENTIVMNWLDMILFCLAGAVIPKACLMESSNRSFRL